MMETLLALAIRLLRNLVANVGLLVLFGAYLGLSQLVKLKAARRGVDADALADVTFWVGIGAVVGGVGNRLMGKRIIKHARAAFGAPPPRWPAKLHVLPSPPG